IVMYLLVQEGMAYAQIAGMPPQTVFYVAPAALLLCTIFANSHKLVVGSATQTALSKGAEAALATAASRPRRRQRGQLRPLPLRSRAPLPLPSHRRANAAAATLDRVLETAKTRV